MKKPWLKTLFKKNDSPLTQNEEEKKLDELIDYLWKKIKNPNNAPELRKKIQLFHILSLKNKLDILPDTYLLLEEHLTQQETEYYLNQKLLRNEIVTQFDFALKYPNFSLIFEDLEQQEHSLCRIFLTRILDKSSELFENFEDATIFNIKKHFETPYDPLNTVTEEKKLLEYSSDIFSKIKNSFGEGAVDNIYISVYKKHFNSYHLLDSFTATLKVIPDDIFDKDLTLFPSRQQMLKMLKKQLHSLGEVNDQLTRQIEERKKVEEDLKYSEHLKTRILDTAMDGIILIDQNGTVLTWNKKAENILKVKKEETIGQSIYPLVPYKLRQELKESFESYIKTGEGELINKRVETFVVLKDGTVVYVELTIIAIKTKDHYLFNAFFRDITDKKLIDLQIREAKILAENSAKAKSTFLSNMSHEIRTPLNVILGLTSILKKSDFSNPEVDKTNLDGIQFSAENLLVLINDILDFSKIEAGKLTFHKTDFNIHELIQNVSRGFKIKANEKGLNYEVTVDSAVPKFIIGDQFRLNQVLTNLLGNAIKFTKKGKVTIEVTIASENTESTTILFKVSDTGIGIPDDKLKNIFQSFYQVHKPGKNKIEGTGLGLAITKQLIELQGGLLTANSTVNSGSIFEFSITYGRSSLTREDTRYDYSNQTGDLEYLSGLKVLVVEDNKMNQFFMRQLFSNWKIEADVAENGKIALEMIEVNVYDLILMDMHMPVMDGPETTQQIRNRSDFAVKSIPIIACSADVFPESKKIAIESGMDYYLTKPISEKALEEVLLSIKTFSYKHSEKSSSNKQPVQEISSKYTTKNSSTICDFSFLEQTFENDTETILSVLEIFLEETPKDYEQLRLAVKERELLTAKGIAHKLKSSFKTIGLQTQANLLQEIENSTKEQEGSKKVQVLVTELDLDYHKIIEEIFRKKEALKNHTP